MSDINRQIIACNIADMLEDGMFVNLGVGIPTLISNYISYGKTVLLHGENGCIGQDKVLDNDKLLYDRKEITEWLASHGGEDSDWRRGHRDLNNAGDSFITMIPGASCFDSAMSFAMARGGRLDATVLGGLQIDKYGNLANWMVPGKMINGMGGAMDLVCGAKKVIVAMEHCSKSGAPKIVEECSLPLTAVACVDVVVTELCIMEHKDNKYLVKSISPNTSPDEILSKTEATVEFDTEVKTMRIPPA